LTLPAAICWGNPSGGDGEGQRRNPIVNDAHYWDMLILGADLSTDGSLTAGDLDGDGNAEIVVGGTGNLMWYRPATFERGLIAAIDLHCGLTLSDIDGDGLPEVVAGHRVSAGSDIEEWMISWYDCGGDLSDSWTQHVIDPITAGGPHDLVFADVDGDGQMELIANDMYCNVPGLYVYKPFADVREPWRKHCVQSGFTGEGTAAGDLTGDGQVDIISGPYLYTAPPDGPFAGRWEQRHLAFDFREMCRVALVDITGNGRLDLVVTESEYPDGRLAWFENCADGDGTPRWIEHRLLHPLNFSHSLTAWRDAATGRTRVFVAEMAQGGWNPPYNWDARLLVLSTNDGGASWQVEEAYRGAGTHEAIAFDIDGDGDRELLGKECWRPRVQVWKRREAEPPAFTRPVHRFLDREKGHTATDILAVDLDGDGLLDIVCGEWWYRNPTWKRYAIPGIYQAIAAHDITGDGRQELIATRKRTGARSWYEGLTSDMCWLRALDPTAGRWEAYPIGAGRGDWPHGALIAPVLPGNRPALIVGYHNADEGAYPEIFEIPEDSASSCWPSRVLAEIPYGEEFVACDLTGNGELDLVAGRYWLENTGDGDFLPHEIAPAPGWIARVRVMDVNGNGRTDVVFVKEDVDYDQRVAAFVEVGWLENPGDPRSTPWPVHTIDTVRSPHSLDVADLDGDGRLEIVVGEHDPFRPYRSRSRLLAYKQADPRGHGWYRYTLDDRFEHHDGVRIFETTPGRMAIASHGWAEPLYVHLWEFPNED